MGPQLPEIFSDLEDTWLQAAFDRIGRFVVYFRSMRAWPTFDAIGGTEGSLQETVDAIKALMGVVGSRYLSSSLVLLCLPGGQSKYFFGRYVISRQDSSCNLYSSLIIINYKAKCACRSVSEPNTSRQHS